MTTQPEYSFWFNDVGWRRELRHRSRHRGRQRAAGLRRGTRPAARARAGSGAGEHRARVAGGARIRAATASRARTTAATALGSLRAAAALADPVTDRAAVRRLARFGHDDRAIEAAMDEPKALAVIAVRAIETADRARALWSDADRSWASRAAAEVVGERRRSTTSSPAGAEARARPHRRARRRAGAAVAGVALAPVGRRGDRRRGVLARRGVRRPRRRAAHQPARARRSARWSSGTSSSTPLLASGFVRARRGRGRPGRCAGWCLRWRAGCAAAASRVIARRLRRRGGGSFAADWSVLAAPLYAARTARILHVAAAALAGGVIAGLYVRGVAFEYRATWESTFLDRRHGARDAAVAYAPGHCWSRSRARRRAHGGDPRPGERERGAVAAPAGGDAGGGGDPAARRAGRRRRVVEHRRAARVLPLNEPYFARLVRGFKGGRGGSVVPYSYEAVPRPDTLRRLLARTFGGSRDERGGARGLRRGGRAARHARGEADRR